ncbi:hypothetical protein Plhal304r1_c017g0061321 [Plasmopara halstedii]
MQKELFHNKELLSSTYVPTFRIHWFDFDWTKIGEDELRFFKVAVQSNDQAKLVREALKGFTTFEGMFKNEKFVQWVQAGLKDETSVQLFQADLNGVEIEVKPLLILPKSDVEIREEESDVVTVLHEFILDKKTLDLLKMFMADDEGVKKLRDFLGRFTVLDDMLSSKELDTMPILKAILEDQNKVRFLEEAVKDEEKLESFRTGLMDKEKLFAYSNTLGDTNLRSPFRQVRNNMNQVFSLRVAIKDDDRAELFRAALKNKEQVEKFMNALKQKKLANIFRSILQDQDKVGFLKSAVADEYYTTFEEVLQRNEREKLAKEMLQYLKALEQKEDRNP